MTLFLPSRVINTCTVRDKSVNSFQSLYDEAKRSGKAVVIAGCMTEADRDMKKRFTQDSIVGVTEIGSIKEVVDAALAHHPVHTQKQDTLPPLDLPKIRKDPSVEIIPISLGCNGSCTFCQTKLARGNLRSYQIAEILKRVDQSVKEGVSEIWLTSEDTGAYGQDIHSSLTTLLTAVTHRVESTVDTLQT